MRFKLDENLGKEIGARFRRAGEVGTLIARLSQADITGKLWVVQRGRIREYQEETDEL